MDANERKAWLEWREAGLFDAKNSKHAARVQLENGVAVNSVETFEYERGKLIAYSCHIPQGPLLRG